MNLPTWKYSVTPNRLRASPPLARKPPIAMRIVAGTRLCSRPAKSARTAPGSDDDEIDRDRHQRDRHVEQEMVARLVRVERIRQDPALGHEHVRREERPDRQRPAAGDVHERRQEPDRAREELAGRGVRVRVERVARRRERRRHHQHGRHDRRPDDGQRGQPRPAVVLEVRLDRDRDGQDRGRDEVQDRRVACPRVVELALGQEGEQSGQEEPEREAVPEPRPPEQERRAETEPAGRPQRPGQVPGLVQRLAPARGAAERLAARRDPVEEHPERPDELEGLPTDAPLIEQRQREDEGQHRGQAGDPDERIHEVAAASWKVAMSRSSSRSSSPDASS